MKVAVVGDSVFTSGFELVGFNGFEATSQDEVIEKVEQLIEEEEYGLILLPERFTGVTKEIREALAEEGQVAPTFTFLPDYREKGQRISDLNFLIYEKIYIIKPFLIW